MTDGHTRRLIATLTAFEELMQQMEAAANGRSPAGGQRLTPLPPQRWQAIYEPLERARKRLERTAGHFAVDRITARGRPEPIRATVRWLSLLLIQIESEVVNDLLPARMSRFGPLTPAEQDEMNSLVLDLKACVVNSRSCLAAPEILEGED